MIKENKYARDLALKTIDAKLKKGKFQEAAKFIFDTDKQYGFPKTIVKKTLNMGAKSFFENGDYEASLYLYHRLHQLNPENKTVFSKFISSFENFWYSLEKIIETKESAYFTEDDITKYSNAISFLLNFHKVNFHNHKAVILKGKQFLDKLEYIKKFKLVKSEYHSKDVESVASFRITKIYNAIYEEMTLDQVYQEAARILAPTFREMLNETEDSKKNVKEKSKKKKNRKTKKP